MLSSFCLKYYENPIISPDFDSKDPKWVGAWWIGFIILGFAIFFASFPVAFFPKQINMISLTEGEDIPTENYLGLHLSLKKLIKNPILLFHTLSITFQINGLFGYFVFMPKYMESQYHRTASSASFFSGSVTLFAMVIGVFLGGWCIRKFKPKPRYLIGYMLCVEIFGGIMLLSAVFMGCESVYLQKDTAALYNSELQNCSIDCACSSRMFYPICDINNNTHFSPCSAGCKSYDPVEKNKKRFHNCSCVTPSIGDNDYQATSGYCSGDCSLFIPYMIVITIAKMFSATARVGNVLVTLRCVDEKDKTLALGSVEFFISIFATIPYPFLYGIVMNKACILWDTTCEHHGNCWIYDSSLLRKYLHSLSLSFIFLGICCDFIVFVMSSKMKNFYGTSKKIISDDETNKTKF